MGTSPVRSRRGNKEKQISGNLIACSFSSRLLLIILVDRQIQLFPPLVYEFRPPSPPDVIRSSTPSTVTSLFIPLFEVLYKEASLPQHWTRSIRKKRGKMKLLVTQILLCATFLLLALHVGLTISEEVEDESQFNYDAGSERGPARWGEIRSEWSMCMNGSMQSPIDLSSERVRVEAHLGKLKRHYEASNATLKNRGHDIMLRWEGDAGFICVNGTQYLLKQCHWHSPSEHAVNGRRFDLELHMVHESHKGEVAVIGVMYKLGQPDSFLSSMMKHIQGVTDTQGAERAIGIVNPNSIKIKRRKYYRYVGSLTVPPCTQNVLWTIVQKVRTVTREQVKLLREAVRDDSEFNARPLQPINRRPVQLFSPSESRLESSNP